MFPYLSQKSPHLEVDSAHNYGSLRSVYFSSENIHCRSHHVKPGLGIGAFIMTITAKHTREHALSKYGGHTLLICQDKA